jgi:hypothetical protein
MLSHAAEAGISLIMAITIHRLSKKCYITTSRYHRIPHLQSFITFDMADQDSYSDNFFNDENSSSDDSRNRSPSFGRRRGRGGRARYNPPMDSTGSSLKFEINLNLSTVNTILENQRQPFKSIPAACIETLYIDSSESSGIDTVNLNRSLKTTQDEPPLIRWM